MMAKKKAYPLGGMWLIISIAIAFGMGNAAKAIDPDTYEIFLRTIEQGAKVLDSVAEKQRLDVLQLALELDKEQRQAAKDERQIIEGRIKKLQLQVEQKQWALSQFEVGERQLIPQSSAVPNHMKHWARARDITKEQFLNYPEKSRGAIKSGRALNFFLDACGPTALDHQVYREQLGAVSNMIVLTANDESATEARSRQEKNMRTLGMDPEGINIRLALLDEIRGPRMLTGVELSKVIVQQGLTGYALKSRLNEGPLPLDWPEEIRSDPGYAPHCKAIETAKQDAIKQLSYEGGIPLSVQRTLMTEADALYRLCEYNAREHFSRLREGTSSDATRGLRFTVAKRFLKEFRGGISRFVAARDPSDIQSTIFPPSGGKASVDELMAFMSRHGLRFAEADYSAEPVYELLYRQMCKYYVDLYGLYLAVESEEQKIALNEQQVQKLMNREFEKFTDPNQTSSLVGHGGGGGLLNILEKVARGATEARDTIVAVRDVMNVMSPNSNTSPATPSGSSTGAAQQAREAARAESAEQYTGSGAEVQTYHGEKVERETLFGKRWLLQISATIRIRRDGIYTVTGGYYKKGEFHRGGFYGTEYYTTKTIRGVKGDQIEVVLDIPASPPWNSTIHVEVE
ncbi:MAG: hypothetical protein GXY83_13930 [Rhodopirellula sp.]|nr:hypothetical protein [Rhodopirellula sp.]